MEKLYEMALSAYYGTNEPQPQPSPSQQPQPSPSPQPQPSPSPSPQPQPSPSPQPQPSPSPQPQPSPQPSPNEPDGTCSVLLKNISSSVNNIITQLGPASVVVIQNIINETIKQPTAPLSQLVNVTIPNGSLSVTLFGQTTSLGWGEDSVPVTLNAAINISEQLDKLISSKGNVNYLKLDNNITTLINNVQEYVQCQILLTNNIDYDNQSDFFSIIESELNDIVNTYIQETIPQIIAQPENKDAINNAIDKLNLEDKLEDMLSNSIQSDKVKESIEVVINNTITDEYNDHYNILLALLIMAGLIVLTVIGIPLSQLLYKCCTKNQDSS